MGKREILNKTFPSIPCDAGVSAVVCVVLVAGGRGDDMACYMGLVHPLALRSEENKNEAAQWTAHFGSKLSYKQALNYFPMLKEETYRL